MQVRDGLASKWKMLSLSHREGKNVVLSTNKQYQEYILAAKFLTKRSVNIDAVAKTFETRTTQKFNVRDARENHLLFAFEVESDVDKVLMGEPWSFDRHLVLLQRYDGKTAMKDLDFTTSILWVQIHSLPFCFLSPVVAISIGETLGDVQ